MPEQITRFPVLSVSICAATPDTAVNAIDAWIRSRDKHYVLACSVNDILTCHDSADLTRIVNNAGLAVPDGMPLVWLGKLRRLPVRRVYGPDLMLAVFRKGEGEGYRHFLYGGTPEILDTLESNLHGMYPDIKIVGRHAPPFRALSAEEKQGVVTAINEAQPDIVWVGLGAPKQNYWVDEFRELLDAPVLMAVGAAFNFHAGMVKQAPRWMMSCGLEWFFRLTQEPTRLWKRYLIGNPRFVILVAIQAVRNLFTRRDKS